MAAAPFYGQVQASTIPTVLSATPLAPTLWVIRAPWSNVGIMYIGDAFVTTATGFPVEPGDFIEYANQPVPGALFDLTPSGLYVVGTPGNGDVLAWLAFR